MVGEYAGMRVPLQMCVELVWPYYDYLVWPLQEDECQASLILSFALSCGGEGAPLGSGLTATLRQPCPRRARVLVGAPGVRCLGVPHLQSLSRSAGARLRAIGYYYGKSIDGST